nr:MAG TPA: hypothetical protein [Caudoviricetes sp.]
MAKTVKKAKTTANKKRAWVEEQCSKFMNDDIKSVLLDEDVIHFLELNASNTIKYSIQKIKEKKEFYIDQQMRNILNRYIHHLIDLQQMDILNLTLDNTQLNNKYRFMRAFEKIRSSVSLRNLIISVDFDNQDHYMDIDVGRFTEKVYQQLDRIEKIEKGFKGSMELWVQLTKKIRNTTIPNGIYKEDAIIHYFVSRIQFEKLYQYRDELGNLPYPPTSIIQYINAIIEHWEKEYHNRGIFLLKRFFRKLPDYVFSSPEIKREMDLNNQFHLYRSFSKKYNSMIVPVTKDLHAFDLQLKANKPSNELFTRFINDYHSGVTKPLLDCNSESDQIPYVFKDWINLILHKANHFSWKMTGMTLQQVDIY